MEDDGLACHKKQDANISRCRQIPAGSSPGGLIGFIAVIACMYLLSLYVDPAIREAAGSSNVQTLVVAQITGTAPMTALQIGALVGTDGALAGVGRLDSICVAEEPWHTNPRR